MDKPITMSREALYQLVWSEPISTLAKRFDLSDQGLSKKCAKHRIPCPKVGYWAKVQHGHQPDKTPLPLNSDRILDTVTFFPKLQDVVASPTPANQTSYLDDKQLAVVMAFGFPKEVKRFHPAIAAYKKAFTGRKIHRYSSGIDRYGRITTGDNIGLKITPKTLDRACRLLHGMITLCREIDWGFTKKQHEYNQYKPATYAFTNNNESVAVEIKELVTQVKRDKDPAKADRLFSFEPVYDYQPTGILELSISKHARGFKTRWKETPTMPLESHITEIMQSLSRTFEHSRLMRIERENERRKREEEEARQRRRQQQAAIERECQQQLFTLANNGAMATNIRALVDSLTHQASHDTRLKQWLTWASDVADTLDPTQQHDMFLNGYEKIRSRDY